MAPSPKSNQPERARWQDASLNPLPYARYWQQSLGYNLRYYQKGVFHVKRRYHIFLDLDQCVRRAVAVVLALWLLLSATVLLVGHLMF